ncbi:MAG: ATP synthase F0 subunit B [Candidatus Riflebacteria bacterium GWC2_50_8]|nr:MAG: ATP synthase F0 subunit B [Candidatus Riflebacteria bacterium GWC2_50_8]
MHKNLNLKILLLPLLVLLMLHCTPGMAAENLAAETHNIPVAAGTHAEPPGLFDFDLSILISQTINFFVLLFILKKFLFVPLGEVVEERRRHLGRIKLAAEEEHRIALSLKEVYEGHLSRIQDEIYEIKQQAILEANHEKEEIIEEARKKAEEIIEQGEMEIFMERQTAWARIREEVVQLTLMAAEKVVEESLDDDMHHRLIQNTIERLEQNLPDNVA